MTNVKQTIKRLFFSLLGLDPEPVIVCVHSGSRDRAERMSALMRDLVPGLEHIHIHAEPGATSGDEWLRVGRILKDKRIGLAAVLFDGEPNGASLRRAMMAHSPGKILAFNAALERHHLSATSPVASWLFLRGVPLDRIWLRPSWLWPFKRDRSVLPAEWRSLEGRPFRDGFPRVAILSPYLPWPLSHGGAVRIWNLLRESVEHYDVMFFGFEDGQTDADLRRIAELCPRVFVAAKPRYREPRWSTLRPPEVCEFYSRPLHTELRRILAEYQASLLQVEYTQMASYGGDVLVEHDVTFDLFTQVHERAPSAGSWWNLFRWRRFETRAVRRYRRVVTMSDKDTAMLGVAHATAVPNGVDLERFAPTPEPEAGDTAQILFIGSFRHFPNRQAWEFFVDQVWPLLEDLHERLRVTVVAGPDPHLYWNRPAPHANIEIRGFTADVKPLYDAANIVIVPTVVSAGTNLKALEAMATERAMVSTPSGVAGLGLAHGESVWIGETPQEFAAGIRTLLADRELRSRIAVAAREIAVARFGWPALARLQLDIWDDLTGADSRLRAQVRPMTIDDLDAVASIQNANPEASQWSVRDYLAHDTAVAVCNARVVAFVVSRHTAPDEIEILNVAVSPGDKRRGLATTLLTPLLDGRATLFLEVRESNAAARGLYERLGFKVSGRRRAYYANPAEDALVLTRDAA